MLAVADSGNLERTHFPALKRERVGVRVFKHGAPPHPNPLPLAGGEGEEEAGRRGPFDERSSESSMWENPAEHSKERE